MAQVFRFHMKTVSIMFAILLLAALPCFGQKEPEPAVAETPAKVETPKTPKTIFRDSDGKLISNNEFVDIRMANFHYPDATLMKIANDGTVEFRLQKIPQEGMSAPEFSASKLDGKLVRFTDLKGKVIVLNFWFIGCPVCFSEMPKLNALAAKFAGNKDVAFIAMTADPADSVKKFLAREKFDYQPIADAKAALVMFGFSGYPKNIVIGKDGKIVYWRSTVRAWDKFDSVIQAELDRK